MLTVLIVAEGIIIALLFIYGDFERFPNIQGKARVAFGVGFATVMVAAMLTWAAFTAPDSAEAAVPPEAPSVEPCSIDNPCGGGTGNQVKARPKKMAKRYAAGAYGTAKGNAPAAPAWVERNFKKAAKSQPQRWAEHWRWVPAKGARAGERAALVRQWDWGWAKWAWKSNKAIGCLVTFESALGWNGCGKDDDDNWPAWYTEKAQPVQILCNGLAIGAGAGGALFPGGFLGASMAYSGSAIPCYWQAIFTPE